MNAATSDANTLFFESLVRGYVDENPRFVRRDWLATELDEKLREQGKSFVLLIGEFGAGKSSFIAQLAHDHPEWLRYFIRRDQRAVLADVSDKFLLLRIGYQLAARRPELFTSDALRMSISQKIGEVANQGEVVGAEFKRLTVSPFFQRVLEIEQQVHQNNGRVVGLRIENLFVEPRLLAAEDLKIGATVLRYLRIRQIVPGDFGGSRRRPRFERYRGFRQRKALREELRQCVGFETDGRWALCNRRD